jgi:hypothetical protein
MSCAGIRASCFGAVHGTLSSHRHDAVQGGCADAGEWYLGPVYPPPFLGGIPRFFVILQKVGLYLVTWLTQEVPRDNICTGTQRCRSAAGDLSGRIIGWER